MGSFKKTCLKSFPSLGEKITPDTLYWKNLEFPITKKEYGAVTFIEFSPKDPHYFAVTNSSRVQVYNPRTNQIFKTISRFRDEAFSGRFRGDGKLLCAGSAEGIVKLFDVSSKSLLRSFKTHTSSVHVSCFTDDGLRIMSGSDDKTVRILDIASESEITKYSEHSDYVRCGNVCKASKDIVITGSYDHTVKLFDTRTDSSILTVEHGHPVDSVLMFPGGGVFISAGGNVVKVWDALAGGKLITKLNNHHKEITCMCFASNYRRLVSGSLDRHVKIYDVSTYQVVHTLDYPSPILSVGVSPDDNLIAVGMADGLLSIQHRKPEKDEETQVKKKTSSYRFTVVGKTHTPSNEDFVVEEKRKEQLAKYDRYFKRFEHSKALDAALEIRLRMKSPDVTISVMLELIRRGGLRAALAGRDEKSLGIILKFIQKNISNPKYMSVLIDVADALIDIYAPQIGNSSAIDDLLLRLQFTVKQETMYMNQLLKTIGTVETILSASNAATSITPEPIPLPIPQKSDGIS